MKLLKMNVCRIINNYDNKSTDKKLYINNENLENDYYYSNNNFPINLKN